MAIIDESGICEEVDQKSEAFYLDQHVSTNVARVEIKYDHNEAPFWFKSCHILVPVK